VDYCFNISSSVGAGVGEQLHDGRIYSYPAGDCDNSSAGQSYSRPENRINP